VKLGSSYSSREWAVGSAIRIMMDDHFFWAIPLERFWWGSFDQLKTMMGRNRANAWNMLRLWLFKLYAGIAFNSRSKGHGIGLHSVDEIKKLTLKDLKTLSDILGDDRKFILGNEPSEYDAAVYGHVAVAMWGLPGSVFEKSLHTDGAFKNLKDYCWRMRETYYPDWDKLVYIDT